MYGMELMKDSVSPLSEMPEFESILTAFSNPVIGVKPATEYQFRIFATPVGPYFKGGVKPLTLRISDLDRAAPMGTGHIKAGLNYAMSLYNIVDAHDNGFDENMYVDSATRTHIEETGGANIIFITKDNKEIYNGKFINDIVEIVEGLR